MCSLKIDEKVKSNTAVKYALIARNTQLCAC